MPGQGGWTEKGRYESNSYVWELRAWVDGGNIEVEGGRVFGHIINAPLVIFYIAIRYLSGDAKFN